MIYSSTVKTEKVSVDYVFFLAASYRTSFENEDGNILQFIENIVFATELLDQ